ncbi:hypothetical protein QP794_25665 [Paenibacillus sp. UMB7766-LJ446]|uniref:hypothetical protein n=1 Tax=Paenibacillus sp. UMB7766-LJ446 TaxID=3046313 RepID=UPI00254E9AE5|nr:hypothetical protein [Paenibacillus sp. UMB7766-LJ446]MDK8193483.1 hypothetical protein [Paenibacillus sp. UMB7766-LJ446]
MDIELEPTKKKKMNTNKISKELVSLNFSWWKNHGDSVIYNAFISRLFELASDSMEVAESYFLQLQKWTIERGLGYQRIHRFQIRLSIGETIIDIKINDCDYEFYLFVDAVPKKIFKNPGEIQPWIENEYS